MCPIAVLLCNVQAACDDEAEKCERAFILQLLGSGGSNGGKEVFLSFF